MRRPRELAGMNVRLGVYGDDAPEQLARVARALGRPVQATCIWTPG